MFKENLFTDTNPTQPERIRPEQKPALGDTPEMAKKREQLRKIVFNYLEKEGALSQGGVRTEENMIVDLEKFKEVKLKPLLFRIYHFNEKFSKLGKRRSREIMANAFLGLNVYSKEDWEQKKNGEDIKTKPLLYQPESAEAAFDLDKIRNQEFHLAPWEVCKHANVNNVSQPTLSGEKVDMTESNIACLVYHRNFGRGRRDENGKLMVFWPSKNEFRPISEDWFGEEFGFFPHRDSRKTEIQAGSSPKLFFNEKTPNLKKLGLITPADFKSTSVGPVAEKFRTEIKINPHTGSVMIRGIKYYIGKGNNKFKDARVAQITPKMAGVIQEDPISGRKKITHVFNLLEYNAPGLKVHSKNPQGKIINYYADKKTTNLQEYSPDELYATRPNETSEAFSQRKNAFEDFDYLLKFSNRLSEEAGLNISLLNYEQQSIIASAARFIGKDPERIIEFGKKFGLEGIKAFIASSHGAKYTESILEIADKLSPSSAKLLFTKYARVVDIAEDVVLKLKETLPEDKELSDQEIMTIRENLLKKGNELIEHTAKDLRRAEGNKFTMDLDGINQSMENINISLLIFGSVFKSLYEEGAKINLEDFKNISLEMALGSQIRKEDGEVMKEMHLQNRRDHSSEFLAETAAGFDQSLKSDQHRFYLLKHHQEGILGFARFHDLDQKTTYAAALNIVEGAKSSKIGCSFLKKILDREARDKIIRAAVKPTKPIAVNYLEQFGFNVDAVDFNFHETNEIFFKITRNDALNNNLKTRQIEAERLIMEYKVEKKNQNYQVKEFDSREGEEKLARVVEGMLNQGYLLTRLPQNKNHDKFYLVFEKRD